MLMPESIHGLPSQRQMRLMKRLASTLSTQPSTMSTVWEDAEAESAGDVAMERDDPMVGCEAEGAGALGGGVSLRPADVAWGEQDGAAKVGRLDVVEVADEEVAEAE